MRRTPSILVFLALIAPATAPPRAASAAPVDGGACVWSQVPVPLPPEAPGPGSVEDVLAFSATDAWAVGEAQHRLRFDVLAEHWDGAAWALVHTPTGPGSSANAFNGVDGLGSSDLWAVGSWADSGYANGPLIEHWDGVAWTQVSAPGWHGSRLEGVAAIAVDDVWAVGLLGRRPLVDHWDGAAWTRTETGSISDWAQLSAVDGSGPDDVWAVGYDTLTNWQTLVMHYDGAEWTIVPSPTPGDRGLLSDVAVVSSTEAWAVGEYQNGVGPMHRLVERWDGASWSVVAGPPLPERQTSLEGLTATSTGVLAVGSTATSDFRKSKPWGIELRDGAWRALSIPQPASDLSELHAVTSTEGAALAVGASIDELAVNFPLAYSGCS